MPARVPVADEEPALRRPGGAGPVDDRPHHLPEHRVRGARARVELRVQPGVAGDEAARPVASAPGSLPLASRRFRSGLDRGVGGRRGRHEGHDQLVDEVTFGRRHGEALLAPQLHQGRGAARLHQIDERLHVQHAVQVDGQHVVAVGEAHPAIERQRLAELLHGAVARRAGGLPQPRELIPRQVPPRGREDRAPLADPGQERRAGEGAPGEAGRVRRVLVRQGAEEAVDAQRGQGPVVGAGQARDDLPAKARRPQDDAAALDPHQQVTERDLLRGRGAGPAKVRDLPAAEHRTAQDVAHAPLGQVHDLREQGVGARRLLGREVSLHSAAERDVAVAEAAEQQRPRGARDRVDEELEGVVRAAGPRRDRGDHGEGVRQARGAGRRQDLEVGGVERPLPRPGARDLDEPAQLDKDLWIYTTTATAGTPHVAIVVDVTDIPGHVTEKKVQL